MDADDYMAIGTGVDTTLSGLEERRPLTLLQLPGENGNASTRSSMSDLGSPIYERRSRHDIVSLNFSFLNFEIPSPIFLPDDNAVFNKRRIIFTDTHMTLSSQHRRRPAAIFELQMHVLVLIRSALPNLAADKHLNGIVV
ncbi:hypothetical protein OUZ56_022445 [Daphnia magna]|uniref:Uncharacterized protein n=1 Tax=Daphnia magna TaxID=35525 RepID=A0ABR0AWE8_9CRUS|nr:hypothetical protein OUZ56_022445 [Daphnia magna]